MFFIRRNFFEKKYFAQLLIFSENFHQGYHRDKERSIRWIVRGQQIRDFPAALIKRIRKKLSPDQP